MLRSQAARLALVRSAVAGWSAASIYSPRPGSTTCQWIRIPTPWRAASLEWLVAITRSRPPSPIPMTTRVTAWLRATDDSGGLLGGTFTVTIIAALHRPAELQLTMWWRQAWGRALQKPRKVWMPVPHHLLAGQSGLCHHGASRLVA